MHRWVDLRGSGVKEKKNGAISHRPKATFVTWFWEKQFKRKRVLASYDLTIYRFRRKKGGGTLEKKGDKLKFLLATTEQQIARAQVNKTDGREKSLRRTHAHATRF